MSVGCREQGIEFAALFQRMKFVTTANMLAGDEDLRHAACPAAAREHLFTQLWCLVDAVLLELNRRFGLGLEHDETALRDLHARALALMDAHSDRRFGRSVSGANPDRDRAVEDRFKDRAREILDSDALKARMETARSLYREILERAGLAVGGSDKGLRQ